MNIISPDHHHYFDLNTQGLLKISGPDTAKLLQGQFTCDVNALAEREGCFGAHCTPQGRILSLFHLFRHHDAYYLLLPASMVTIALSALKKYAPFYKTTLEDATGTFFVIGAQDDTGHFDSAATYRYPESGRMIYLLPSAPAKALGAYHDWHYLDLLEGIPAIYPETSGLFLPHDLNLPALGAVSFSKGCYTGQEIIARMEFRGKPKNHLYRAKARRALAPATEIMAADAYAGTVIDCSQQMYNDYYPLLFVANESSAAAESLQTREGILIEIQKSE